MTTKTVNCYDVRVHFSGYSKTELTTKKATIQETAPGQFEVRHEGCSKFGMVWFEMGKPDTLRMVAGVLYAVLSDNSLRIRAHHQCWELGYYAIPGYDESRQQAAYEKDTQEFLSRYRANTRPLTGDNAAEALNELGPDAINCVTGRRLFPRPTTRRGARF